MLDVPCFLIKLPIQLYLTTGNRISRKRGTEKVLNFDCDLSGYPAYGGLSSSRHVPSALFVPLCMYLPVWSLVLNWNL